MENLTMEQKLSLSTVEIAKRIKEALKQFKHCKFSVRSEYYSMGSSITVSLMESSIKVLKDFKEIPESVIKEFTEDANRGIEALRAMQERKYHQLNEFQLREEYDNTVWCNGVFLTREGHELLKEVVKIADSYNYDHSDSQTDYYDVKFSFDLHIGRWDKPYQQVTE